MRGQTERRSRILAAFWVRLVCFAFALILVLSYLCYVLTPKYDYGICGMLNLYRQPRNSVDVLVVGTSLAYAGVNTNVLWQEYGIAAYDLCSAEEPFWISYYAIREALKTQRPKLILLDAKPAVYTQDYSKHARTILSTYGILSLENRVGATLACVEKPADAVGYMLGIPQVHGKYKELTLDDFRFPPDNGGRGDNWKGYIEQEDTERHNRPDLIWTDVQRPMNKREEAYARKIFELVSAEGIPLILVGFPNPDYANDHMYYNRLWSVAEEYGITGINYNAPDLRFGLRYSSDFADWQHLNVKGSITFSRRLGEDLRAHYDLPDRRGDVSYASYDACAEAWYQRYPAYDLESAEEDQP